MLHDKLISFRCVLTAAILLLMAGVVSCQAGGGRRNVVVVANTNSAISMQIADYYVQKHSIPAAQRINVTCATTEFVDWTSFDTQLRQPLRSALSALEAQGRKIDYIVTTKGMPLVATRNGTNYSVENVLTCLSEPGFTNPITNPYGPVANAGQPAQGIPGWGVDAPVVAFSHSLNLAGHYYYLVARLDGYNFDLIKSMIDDCYSATPEGTFLIDRRDNNVLGPGAYYSANARLGTAANMLRSRGFSVVEDKTETFLSGYSNLIAYFSWGSNEPSFTQQAYTSHQLRPGSLVDSYVSTSGRTFTFPNPNPYGFWQSLIADLFPQGASAGAGYVDEPYIYNATYPAHLFDRYTTGYNAVESFFAACPLLHWRTVVVGDPLLAPWATKPNVSFGYLPDELTDAVTIEAIASDASGISKVEFYLDDTFLGQDTTAPYRVTFDSTLFSNGPHTLEAIAYENSAVATQGAIRVPVTVANSPYHFYSVINALGQPNGTMVAIESANVAFANVSGSRFFVLDSLSSAGIEVQGTYPAVFGQRLRLFGTLSTSSGHRVLILDTCEELGGEAVPVPIAMRCEDVGGISPYPEVTPSLSSVGAYNIGSFVQLTGYLESVDTIQGVAYLQPGYLQTPLKIIVDAPWLNTKDIPAANKMIRVVGIATTDFDGAELIPAVAIPTWASMGELPVISWSHSLGRGFNEFVLPIDPLDCTARNVFMPVSQNPQQLPLERNLLVWNTQINDWVALQSSSKVYGGAVIYLRSVGAVTFQYLGVNGTTSANSWISFGPAGTTRIGIRGELPVALQECRVYNGLLNLNLTEAVGMGWLSSVVYMVDLVTRQNLPFSIYEPALLYPGVEYIFTTTQSNLALIAPSPAPIDPPSILH